MKNDYEIKKEEKERAKQQERTGVERKKTKKSLVRLSVWFVVLALGGYGIFLLAANAGPQGEDFSVAYDVQGRIHIDVNSVHPPYSSNPPSSGWHWGSPVRGGFYDSPFVDETIIHNLEHGDIWITYQPDISDDAKSLLKKIAGRHVIVSPRSENNGNISLVSWGRVDTFDIENGVLKEDRIKDFILRYDNRGPEKVRTIRVGTSRF